MDGTTVIAAIERFLESVMPQAAPPSEAPKVIVDQRDKAKVPWSGACLVLANSAADSAEAWCLVSELRPIRPDIHVLWDTSDGVARAFAHLKSGGFVVAFPETGGEWSHTPARILRWMAEEAIETPVIPVHISGTDSPVEIRVGTPPPSRTLLDLPDDDARTSHLRWRVESLAFRHWPRAHTRFGLSFWRGRPQLAEIAPGGDPDLIAAEVERLGPGLVECGDLSVHVARASEIPHALLEIGRLREIAFRADSEGTGRERDLDSFDQRYLHLFAWSRKAREIVGAYRLGLTANATPRDLYSATLFDYGPEFLARLGPAIELGRSFIRPEYQKSFAPLLALWKGIGRFVAEHPQYGTLFGPVSISSRYRLASRQLMVACLERWASWQGLAQLVRERNPFPRGAAVAQARAVDLDQLSDVVADSEPDGAGIPVLLRQYLKLGGKLLGFNIDEDFSGVVDGLIVVDLMRTEPKLLARYLGQREAESFLAFHHRVGEHTNGVA
ncbi:MAG: GNAT family N-acyltransferase [Bryobacteraceae bacterium]